MRVTAALAFLFVSLACAPAHAQQSQSEPVAKELEQLLQKQKLDSIAAMDPGGEDRFVAALYFPGQLLVVSAKYAAPALLREQLLKREYREVYLQLQGASVREGKFFVQDLGANGLQPARAANEQFDIIYESVTNRIAFDGEWRDQKMSEEEYRQKFASADKQYAGLLSALITEAKQAVP